jgi:Protein of unknown function (DUF3592)
MTPSRWLPRLVGAGSILLGLSFVYDHQAHLREARSADSWPSVQGTLLDIHRTNCEGARSSCRILAAYSYRVPSPSIAPSSASDANGTYTGTRITFADHDLLYGDWEPIRRMYHPGGAVQVFYNPRAPQAAVLARRVPFAPFTPYVISATIGVGVLFLALSFWRRAATWRGGGRDVVP